MNDKDSTGITPACRRRDVSNIEIYPDYRRWERAFRKLTGWPPDSVNEDELRRELASAFPEEGLKQRTPEEAVPIDEAVLVGILKRGDTDRTLRLATVAVVDLGIGGSVLITQIPTQVESDCDSRVSVERI
jgi:hypothetical protein